MLIDWLEITFELFKERLQLTHVQRICFCNDDHQDVFANLHFLHEVFVVHNCNLEVSTLAQLANLILEVGIQFVHATSEAVQEVLICLRLEFDVVRQVLEDFDVVRKLTENYCLNEGHFTHELLGLLL